jgi:signal peptidase I
MRKAPTFAGLVITFSALFFSGEAAGFNNPVTGVSLGTALRDAHALAAHRADLSVVRVEGVSMLPYFGPGAVLVVKHLPAEKLRAGMVAVYTNRFNETVAHGLIAPTAAGWTAGGHNNTTADSTPVTAQNLVGVVYATFHSDGAAPSSTDLLSALTTSTPVALAAPAR